MADITGGASGFQNRRLFWMQPGQVGMTENGTEVVVPGMYLAAAEAARVAQLPPQQSHTNMPLVGFTQPVGSSDVFDEGEMATAAAGGVWWVVQDAPGAALVPRHQLSTDTSQVKTQELSVTKAIDLYAKAIRIQLKRLTGRRNITKALLTQASIILQGVSARYAGVNKALASATIVQLAQDPSRIDGIIATVEVVPWIPANKITIKITA